MMIGRIKTSDTGEIQSELIIGSNISETMFWWQILDPLTKVWITQKNESSTRSQAIEDFKSNGGKIIAFTPKPETKDT